MKFSAFIMAIIILTISCIPCKDGAVSMNSGIKIELAEYVQDHDHEDQGDHCSPLCSCACCSAHSTPQSIHITITSTPNRKPEHCSVYNGSPVSVSIPVWQPPRTLA